MQQQHFIARQVALVLLGFLLVIITVGAATTISIRTLGDSYQRLEHLINESNSQSILMGDMRDAIRDRMLLVYDIIHAGDPFAVDDLVMTYSSSARRFIQARDQLLEHNLTDQQRAQIEAQKSILGQAQTILNEVVTSVQEERNDGSADRILEAREVNSQVLEQLGEMQRVQANLAQEDLAKASSEYGASRNQILILIFAAFAVSSAVVIFIVSRIVSQGRALQQALDALEEANETLEQRVEKRTNELMSTRADNMRMGAELDVSRQLQQMLLPRDEELAAITDLDIAGFMEPADEVGGDYYDVLHYHDHVIIGIGDVTGHGLESGVIMLMVQAAVRSLTEHDDEVNLIGALNSINTVVYQNCKRMGTDKNLTLALLHYNKGELEISGQHEELLLLRSGKVECVDTIDLGFPIGLESEIADFMHSYKTTLNHGDTAVVYTDGITEAESPSGELYDQQRLCTVLEQHHDRSSSEIVTAVIESVKAHMGDRPLLDDISLLVIQRR